LAPLPPHFSVRWLARNRFSPLMPIAGRKNISNLVRTGRSASQTFINEATKDVSSSTAVKSKGKIRQKSEVCRFAPALKNANDVSQSFEKDVVAAE